jgi:hypothetical protein
MPGVTLKYLESLIAGSVSTIQTFLNGVANTPARNAYNFSGSVTVTDNPTLGTKDIAIGSSTSAPAPVALTNANVTHTYADGSVFSLASGTLTGNHTCTVNAGGGAIAGSTMTFLLEDGGAFTYAIINGGIGGGTLFTKPANFSGRLTIRFDGTNWALQEPPSQYGNATDSLAGLFSAADKTAHDDVASTAPVTVGNGATLTPSVGGGVINLCTGAGAVVPDLSTWVGKTITIMLDGVATCALSMAVGADKFYTGSGAASATYTCSGSSLILSRGSNKALAYP